MRLTVLMAALLASGAVFADCKPLLDAMNKVAQQTRFAAYEVNKPEQVPTGDPDVVLIGKVSYVRTGTQWERIQLDDTLLDHAWYWHALRKEIAANQVRCKPAGGGTYRGASVVKYHYEYVGTKDSTGTVWIDRRTGLPVYEGDESGGFAVLYGDAVKEPRVK
jgi:hypothetical protein